MPMTGRLMTIATDGASSVNTSPRQHLNKAAWKTNIHLATENECRSKEVDAHRKPAPDQKLVKRIEMHMMRE